MKAEKNWRLEGYDIDTIVSIALGNPAYGKSVIGFKDANESLELFIRIDEKNSTDIVRLPAPLHSNAVKQLIASWSIQGKPRTDWTGTGKHTQGLVAGGAANSVEEYFSIWRVNLGVIDETN